MTILKTIDGKEINTDDFPGYGQFKEYVQKNIDPAYGKGDTKSTIYEVEMSATKIVNVYHTFEIDAPTKEQAKKQALEQARKLDAWDWEEGVHDEIENIEVESCELSDEGE